MNEARFMFLNSASIFHLAIWILSSYTVETITDTNLWGTSFYAARGILRPEEKQQRT